MEPSVQVEIQLGHMCNNRCVFCVSGQETEFGRARPVDVGPILERIDEAHETGIRKITLLGGEPTLQPGFLEVVRHCVARGFEEIVVFTNGVRTARPEFVDEILATGGSFTWRISLQGADKPTHERTTQKLRSFDRIERSLTNLHQRGQPITVNMCVVQSNYASVDLFPDLLLPYGVRQLHLDMMRPLDAGVRTEEELRATLPRYSDMVGPLTRMIEGFPAGYDVNIGNLPYCIAPHLAPHIHHDGETTWTIAVDGDDELSDPWDKYDVKRRDKVKPPSCGQCLFDARCSGVFQTYRDFYGLDELVPVGPEKLREVDPGLRMLPVHLKPLIASLEELDLPDSYGAVTAVETGDEEVTITLEGPRSLAVVLRPPGPGLASFDVCSLHLTGAVHRPADALRGLRFVWDALSARGGEIVHPLGEDAVRRIAPAVRRALTRLRSQAPFDGLRWTGVEVSPDGRRAELALRGLDDSRVLFWVAQDEGAPSVGYQVQDGDPDERTVAGLRQVVEALRTRRDPAPASR